MKTSKIPMAVLALLVSIMGTACTQLEVSSTEPVKQPVEVVEIQHESYDLKQMYSGRISADSTEALSFMSSGKIAEINVKAGDSVKKGALIARLENQAQSSGVSSSAAQINAAKENAAKAKLSLEHLEKTLEDMSALYEQGAVSKAELDGAALQVAITKSELKAAEAQLQAAQAGYSLNSTYLRDTKLYASRDGVVLEVFYEAGEMISAGYPVLMLEGQAMTAVFGMSAQRILNDDFERDVEVIYDDLHFTAPITKISKLPDPVTQTYEVEVTLPSGSYLIGAATEIYVLQGTVRAVKLPIDIVLSGENDFVYVVEKGKAVKKNVDIVTVQGNQLFVEGLQDDDQVIVKGMKLVKPLDDVEIVNASR